MIRTGSRFRRVSTLGMLHKKWYTEGDSVYMLKANTSPDSYEYFSEAYSSYLADILGIETVRYEIVCAEKYPDVKLQNQRYLSKCEIYNGTGINMYKFLDRSHHVPVCDSAKYYIVKLTELGLSIEELFKRLVFDAFINNEDRHLNNFDILVDGETLKWAPNLDYGNSLLANYPDEYFELESIEEIDSCKFLYATHDDLLSEFHKNYQGNTKFFHKEDIDEIKELIEDDIPGIFSSTIRKDRWNIIKKMLLHRIDKYLRSYEY